MHRYLFHYVELFSIIGAGTPEDPGGDFDMNCWIDAPDKGAALEWGYILLGNYVRARNAQSADGYRHDGSPIRKGEVVEDAEIIATAGGWNLPSCRIGEIPEWCEPWRHSNIRT